MVNSKKIFLVFFGLLVLALAALWVAQISTPKKSTPEGITNAEAVEKVINLPEVKQYISDLVKADKNRFNK